MDFDTERHAVTVKHKGKEVTYYIRELGYYEFQELNREAAQAYPDSDDSDRRGLKVLHDTAVAAIEDKAGSRVFTLETWKRLPKEPATVLTNAAMKAQGIDLQKASDEASPEADAASQGDSAGNV
jgi:hypothetical protein